MQKALIDATLAFVPAALAGAFLGMHVFLRVSDRRFARILSFMLMVSGVALAARV